MVTALRFYSLIFDRIKYKIIIAVIILIIALFNMDIMWLNPHSSFLDYYFEATSSPVVIYLAIPLIVVLIGYNFISDITSNYLVFLSSRYRNIKVIIYKYMKYEIYIAVLISIFLLGMSCLVGLIKGYASTFIISHAYTMNNFIFLLAKFWQIVLYIISIFFLLNLIQIIVRRISFTFVFGILYLVLLFLSYQLPLKLIKNYPILAGQELFYGIYSTAKNLIILPYLSVIWVILEIICTFYVIRVFSNESN